MGRDKAFVEVDGAPMAQRVARAMRGAGALEVVCVGGDAGDVADAFPGAIGIRPASLDDPNIFKPGVSVYISSAPTWATFAEGVPRFPKMPPTN